MLANSIAYLTNASYQLTTSACLFLAQADGVGADAVAEPTFLQRMLGNPLFLPIGLFMIFYLVVLAPERRRKAEEASMLAALKKNDRVITVGGIHGSVVAVNDGVVTLRIDESGNAKIKVNQSAIATRLKAENEKTKND